MTHAAWIEAMLRPEIYPCGTTDITLLQTHISYVFLAGSEVYKVKKPVRFSIAVPFPVAVPVAPEGMLA
jgi:aminoglycoside phosphotransferase family enzyme